MWQMDSHGGWGWSLGKVGKAKTQKAIKWPPKYIQRTAGGPVNCWKEQVSHCVAVTLTKDHAYSICLQSLTKRETLQSTQADNLSLIFDSVKMRITLEICLYLAALLFCLFSANASLETENNEVNVSTQCSMNIALILQYCDVMCHKNWECSPGCSLKYSRDSWRGNQRVNYRVKVVLSSPFASKNCSEWTLASVYCN